MKPKHRLIILPGVVFVVLLVWFVSTGWYEPARFEISGRAATHNARVIVDWDSGNGFNNYERRIFEFLPASEQQHTVRIRRQKEIPGPVVLTEIRADDRGLPIPVDALHEIRHISGSGWVFDSPEAEIILTIPANHRLQFSFKTSTNAGSVQVVIDGQVYLYDLRHSNWEIHLAHHNIWFLDRQQTFRVSLDIPRYRVNTLRVAGTETVSFTRFTLHLREQESVELTPMETRGQAILFDEPTRSLKRYFHPAHVIFQFFFAVLFSGAVLVIISLNRGAGMCAPGKSNRALFWFLFIGSASFYFLWLFAFWPGAMSVDSLNIWRAAQFPDVAINNHPFVNELWYMLLQQMWNNIAVVPIAHILLLSLLAATIFVYVHGSGVAWYWLAPCYLLLLLSVPVGLYNVTLWKDVPFALLVIFWALMVVYWYQRRREGRPVILSIPSASFVLIAFAALLLFRHNGFIYLVVLPTLFIGCRLIRVNRYLIGLGGVLALVFTSLVIFPPRWLSGASYFKDLSRGYIAQIEREGSLPRMQRAAQEYPFVLDIKRNKEQSDWWHYYLGDRYAYDFLRDVGWSDSFPYKNVMEKPFPALHELAMSLYHASFEYPWYYFSWYPFPFMYLFVLSILLFRFVPRSALFSTVILAQVAALLIVVGTLNWRYYYFVLLSGYFLAPILLLDLHCLKKKRVPAR
jgi:hypothetical protein